MVVLFFILFSLLCYVGVVSATDLFPPFDEVVEADNEDHNDSERQHPKKNSDSDDDADVAVEDAGENEGVEPGDEEESDSGDDA